MRPQASCPHARHAIPFLDRIGGLARTTSKVRSRSPCTKVGVASVLPLAMWKSSTPWMTRFIRAMAAVMVISPCP